MPTPRAPGASRHVNACEHRQRGDEFERVLRHKAASRDDAADGDCADTEGDVSGGAAALLPFCAPPALVAAKPAAPALGTTASAEPDLNPTQAALGTALSTDSGAPMAPGLRSDTGSAWEVSLNDPRGVALELRAARPAGVSAAGAPANWTLTIASPVQDAALLARHTPRLNERLRSRALTHTHVRIEGEREDEETP